MMTETEHRSEHIGLALTGCMHCNGTGRRPEGTCGCVHRRIFRAVMNKFRDCATGAHLARPLSLFAASGPKGCVNTGRKSEEFAADVYLTARRTLTDPTEWAVFRFHYLLGAQWKLCGGRMGMAKPRFFQVVYRIEAKLGKTWATLKPYALYPLDEYFSACTRRVDVRPFLVQPARLGMPLRPPMAERPTTAPAPDPFEAVKEGIRAAYSQGQTLTEIGNDLNRRGVLPRRASHWYPAIVRTVVVPRGGALDKQAA